MKYLWRQKVPALYSEDVKAELLGHTGCKLSGRHTANEKLRLGGAWLQPQQYLPAGLGLELAQCGL